MWRKWNILALLVEMLIDTATMEDWRVLKKLGIKPTYEPAIPLLGIYPEETKIEKDTCIPLFIAALFPIVGHGSNLDVHQQMNGYRNHGTYAQWNITQL